MLRITIKGLSPLLMHNERLANKLDPATKALAKMTAKKKKDDSDLEEIARLEFIGGLYHTDELGPYLPAHVIKGSILGGARMLRAGKEVGPALRIPGMGAPLTYDGPRDVDGLWAGGFYDIRGAGVMGKRVMRCRPCFRSWSATFDALIIDGLGCSADLLKNSLEHAGYARGIGDFRPECDGDFGTYKIEKFEEV